MNQAQQVVQGVQGQQLRDSADLRQHVATQLAGVQSVLDGMLVDRPRRAPPPQQLRVPGRLWGRPGQPCRRGARGLLRSCAAIASNTFTLMHMAFVIIRHRELYKQPVTQWPLGRLTGIASQPDSGELPAGRSGEKVAVGRAKMRRR